MSLIFRPGHIQDSRKVFWIFARSLLDYGRRRGVMLVDSGDDAEMMSRWWEMNRTLYEHLARTCSAFWVAERDGEIVGYARAILRDQAQVLTEFFVSPEEQSSGVGGELFRRAFPESGAKIRSINATLDDRAQIRYLKAGLLGRFPIKHFSREPEKVGYETDLDIERIVSSEAVQKDIDRIDRHVVGHVRPQDHAWLAGGREGYLYRRAGEVVGYGYIGLTNGPFALRRGEDYPAVLSHAEGVASTRWDRFGMEVPLTTWNHRNGEEFKRAGFTLG